MGMFRDTVSASPSTSGTSRSGGILISFITAITVFAVGQAIVSHIRSAATAEVAQGSPEPPPRAQPPAPTPSAPAAAMPAAAALTPTPATETPTPHAHGTQRGRGADATGRNGPGSTNCGRPLPGTDGGGARDPARGSQERTCRGCGRA